MIDIEEIEQLLHKPLPKVGKKKETFLDIAGIASREVSISSIYAWFLDENNSHALGTLFLDALQSLIKSKIEFNDAEIITEMPSLEGGRIDIAIVEREGLDILKGIAIENKIYHDLNNNLGDYKNTIKGGPVVVLSLNSMGQNKDGIYYITHKQWMTKIKDNLGHHFSNTNPQSLIYLNEFINSMENFEIKSLDDKGLEYIFDNGETIGKIKSVVDAGIELINNDLWNNWDEENWKWGKRFPDFLTLSNRTYPEHWIYIYYNDVFYTHSIQIDYWIKRNTSNKHMDESRIDETRNRLGLGNERAHQAQWFFGGQDFKSINELSELKEFHKFLFPYLKEKWMPVMNEMTAL